MRHPVRTAILVDGGFVIKRYRAIHGAATPRSPNVIASDLFSYAIEHLDRDDRGYGTFKHRGRELYRIFFSDCPPLSNRAHNPLTGRSVDFSKTPEARFRKALHHELKCKRKLALRLGRLSKVASWTIPPAKIKQLLRRKIAISDLSDSDVRYAAKQKGVDIRIGLDTASLALKRQVDQIVLISGDADFVPAAKLARREGIDFVLDPMWQKIPEDLLEHIDGLRSTAPKPHTRDGPGKQ